MIRLFVGQDIIWDMLPNPTRPRSTISRAAFDDLRAREAGDLAAGRNVPLRQLRIAGQPIPDLHVRVSDTVTRLGVNGVLGLDFFTRFESVQWIPRTGRLTLRFAETQRRGDSGSG